MRPVSPTILLLIVFCGCGPIGWERYSELPEYYELGVRISQPVYDHVKRDTVLKPVYG
jgi:hypothetical protein